MMVKMKWCITTMTEKKSFQGMAARLRRKLRGRGGYSLAEALVALVILLMVSGGMVDGIRFASEQYRKSMELSESKVLYSTLANILRSELSGLDPNNGDFTLSGDTVTSFVSAHYMSEGADLTHQASVFPVTVTVGDDGLTDFEPSDSGELMIGTLEGGAVTDGMLLLGSGAYSSYHLRARVDSITYTDNVFHVTLSILKSDGTTVLIDRNSFDVLPLMDPTASPAP